MFVFDDPSVDIVNEKKLSGLSQLKVNYRNSYYLESWDHIRNQK